MMAPRNKIQDIDRDCTSSDQKIIENSGYRCDEEVIRIIKESGNRIPGKQNGKPVRVLMSLPVSFSISDGKN
jgi:hypothetical protein